MKHYTTIEQSKKLVELGLSPDTADMFYSRRPTGKSEYSVFPDFKPEGRLEVFTKVDLPCWSLGALIELMPKIISVPVDERSAYFYSLEWQFANDNSLRYIATNRGKCLIDIYSDHDTRGKSLIETAFEMVCWLLENGYIKKEK